MKFTIKKNGEDVELEVVAPSVSVRNQSDSQKSKNVLRLAKEGVPLRIKAESVLKEQGYWSDEKEKEFDEIAGKLKEAELSLRKGGISLWNGARPIALNMRELRRRLLELGAERSALDNYTAEGMAESEAIPFLLSKCILQDGKPYYKNAEDVAERTTEDGFADISLNFMKVLYNYTPEDYTARFENKFLIENGLAKIVEFEGEKTIILLDKQGRSIDDDGRLIDEKFRFVDEDGNLVDRWGNRVDEEGNLVVEFQPFTE